MYIEKSKSPKQLFTKVKGKTTLKKIFNSIVNFHEILYKHITRKVLNQNLLSILQS